MPTHDILPLPGSMCIKTFGETIISSIASTIYTLLLVFSEIALKAFLMLSGLSSTIIIEDPEVPP
jgi:hypothetical protein